MQRRRDTEDVLLLHILILLVALARSDRKLNIERDYLNLTKFPKETLTALKERFNLEIKNKRGRYLSARRGPGRCIHQQYDKTA